ncbi:MAG TPA: ABC transporter permease, partial [Chloroflexia bacterium]|nr:ABC transporter permease [Chloroflexia bacterium]
MSFPRIMAITGRIIGQFRRDHRSLGLVFIVPIVVMSILGYVLRAQESRTVNVAVVNEDNPPAGQTSMAQPVISTLEQDENIVVAEMSRADADEAVRNGSQRVALVFKSDFTEQFRSTRKANLEVIVEGSNPGQAGGALATVGQAVQRSAPLLLKQMLPAAMSGAVPDGLPLQ